MEVLDSMDININNLPLYNIFLEVASSKNLSVAASRLFISQPAVSKAIKKLEEQLHSKLFIRSSRGVKLTDDGELLYMHISQAFSEIFQGENLIKTRHSLQNTFRSKQYFVQISAFTEIKKLCKAISSY